MFESYFELYERYVRINLRSLAAHTLFLSILKISSLKKLNADILKAQDTISEDYDILIHVK